MNADLRRSEIKFWISPRLRVSAVNDRVEKIFARGMKKSLTDNFAVRTFVY